MNGRGRPPVGDEKVGTVSWKENNFCFVGSNGFYWHGTKFGGWQTEPPDISPENRKRPMTSGRGRRPRGNTAVGEEVTYNSENDCYQTSMQYFWHGTFQGGWKKTPPGTDAAPEDDEVGSENKAHDSDDAGANKRQKRGNMKGRPPRRKFSGELIEYNDENLCWTTDRDGGLFWHGTYNGGWKSHPPKKRRLLM